MGHKNVGIIGYGVIGAQIEQFIIEQNPGVTTDFFFFDDNLHETGKEKAFLFKDFDSNKFNDLDFYVGLGYQHMPVKNEIINQLKKNKFSLPSIIHKTAYVHPAAVIGEGVVIYPMCNVGIFTTIADGVLINNSSVISHDSSIDRCTFISPAVVLSGRVQIGQNCFIGTSTSIANDIIIGNHVKTGIGTVVTKNIADNLSVIGNPMRIVENLKIK